MLTRRSRKETVVSPNVEDKSSKSKRSKTPLKNKSSTTPRRSKSRSVERKIRTRSKSANKSNILPQVVLERVSPQISEKFKKNAKKNELSNDLKSRKSLTPLKDTIDRSSPFVDKTNNDKKQTSTSRLDYDESDDELQLINNTKAKIFPVEFGGTFGNIILSILLPILVILAKIALKANGNLIPFPRGYLRIINYYDQDVFIWTASIVALQFLISLVPLAKKSEGLQHDDSKPYSYRFSGFVNLIIAILIVVAMDHFKCPIHFIVEIVTKKTVPHIIASILCTLIISTVLYVKSNLTKQVNKFDSLNLIQKFFIGTSNNPELGPINVKLALYRYSVLMTILFNSLVIKDSYNNPANIYLYVVAGLQLFYAVDKLIFEFNLLSSFYLQKEKDGYWTIIQQFLQPIINILPIQILLSKNLSVNYLVLGISSILFLLGYICQRYSDFIRYQYETNSRNAYRTGMKTIMTLGGRRIIVNGLWSYIKYPNYLGAMIVHLALILPVIEPNLNSLQASWPVFLYPLYYIITLFHRCSRVSTYCQFQYGFTRGNQLDVEWNLIPKIF